MVRNSTGWEKNTEIVAKDGIAAVGKLNTALMEAEKVRFSLEEEKRLETANDVAKKVKLLRDTVKDLTETSSFFSGIASPYFKPEGAESEDGFIFGKASVDRLVDRSSRPAVWITIGIGNLVEVFLISPLDGEATRQSFTYGFGR